MCCGRWCLRWINDMFVVSKDGIFALKTIDMKIANAEQSSLTSSLERILGELLSLLIFCMAMQ